MAKKKSKSKYRTAAKPTENGRSSTTSDTSSTSHSLVSTAASSKIEEDDEKEGKGLTEIKFLQNIFDSYLDGYCPHYSSKEGSGVCQQCQKSANPKSEDKPCWYGTSQSTGKILKKYVIEGCLKESKDQDIGDKRSFFMSSFTELLVNSLSYKENPMIDPSTGMPASDIQHLRAIAPEDMYDLYTQSPHAPVRDAIIELLNLVHLVAWKMKHVEKYADEDHTVNTFLNRNQ